jgi:hypothetical protein
VPHPPYRQPRGDLPTNPPKPNHPFASYPSSNSLQKLILLPLLRILRNFIALHAVVKFLQKLINYTVKLQGLVTAYKGRTTQDPKDQKTQVQKNKMTPGPENQRAQGPDNQTPRVEKTRHLSVLKLGDQGSTVYIYKLYV